MLTNITFIFTTVFVLQSFGVPIVHHQQDSSVKSCPEKASEIAQEYLLLELAGRRSLKADDNCYKSLRTKYISQLKDPGEFKSEVIEVTSAAIIDVTFNKEYQQYDVKVEATTTKGKKIKDKFRFMKLGAPGRAKPEHGCGILSLSTKNALVLAKCLP